MCHCRINTDYQVQLLNNGGGLTKVLNLIPQVSNPPIRRQAGEFRCLFTFLEAEKLYAGNARQRGQLT